ncbi:hypothetical protein H0H92_002720 [Tricholoma furcatifolium]|nr:hypothetical protein H0H92_002720 [Tricholoma furcatifolium]
MSSNTIYNPSGPPAQGANQHPGHARLNDSFDAIRHEFDAMVAELNLLRSQKDDLEAKVTAQVGELNKIHQSFYDLENQHTKVRIQYDEEVHRLRNELHAVRTGLQPHPPVGPASIGLSGPAGPSNSLPGIQIASGSQPYNSDPYYPRDRERERERDKEREREQRDRERERDRADRERESENRDRERDRARGGDNRTVDPDYKRGLGDRDPKQRFKQDRIKSDRPDHLSPSLGPGMTPKLPPPPSSTANAPGGPGLPPPPQAPSSYAPGGPSSSNNPPPPPAHSEQPSHAGTLVPIGPGSNSFPDDLDIHSVAPEYKKEGSDWFAIFNPGVKRSLDVTLVHTLMHESVVCCVRFSHDGKFLATGCNRTAQIYDTKTGVKTWHALSLVIYSLFFVPISVLVDEAAGKAGDLYIRSVCFSPDGKYLATGAEDKQIRIWDIAKKRIRTIFDGHQQEIYSLDFSADGRLIVSGSGDKTARIWDMETTTSKVLTINDPDSLNNDAGVTSVAISPNGQLVAAGSLDTVVRIWDVQTAQLVERLRGHKDSVYSVAFTPDGRGLVSGSLDKTLKYWDVSGLMNGGSKSRKEGTNGAGQVNGPGGVGPSGPGGAVVRKDGEKGSPCTMNFLGHKDYVLSVAVSHDGQWVVSGSKDRGVQFWDSRSAIVQCMLQGHKNSVISIDLSPAGNILATGSGDWHARIWSYNTL